MSKFDAAYFRRQAHRCLTIADYTKDRETRARLHDLVREFEATAAILENVEKVRPERD